MSRATALHSSRPAPAGARARAPRHSGVGGTLVVLFVGIALGVGLAAAVASYVMKAGNPYQPAVTATARDPGKEPGRGSRVEPSFATDKPRFDFYKILPG